MKRADKVGYRFAAKLVRGAYMESEGQLAEEQGVPNPIHDSKEATHANYNQLTREVLSRMATEAPTKRSSILLATHNQDSVNLTVSTMKVCILYITLLSLIP